MRNRWYRWFWTELGLRMTEPGTGAEVPPGAPKEMAQVLHGPTPCLPGPEIRLGEPMSARSARHIYQTSWKELRPLGFSRPLRLEPWPGITLLLPFHRGEVAVIPQAFPERVPTLPRILSLAGRSGAASLAGIRLWIMAGRWDGTVVEEMERRGLRAVSPDMAREVFG